MNRSRKLPPLCAKYGRVLDGRTWDEEPVAA